MSFEEKSFEDKVEVVGPYKHIQIRTANVVEKDGVEISRTYQRYVIKPTISAEELKSHSPMVQAISKAVHTKEIKEAYLKMLEENS